METNLYLFIAFLAVNLAVGLYYSRGIKSFRAYAVGDGPMHPWLLAATIAATQASGSGFSAYLQISFNDGVYRVIGAIFLALALVFVGFFVLRMGEFYGTTSIAGAMGRLYGSRVALATGMSAVICCVGKLACQLLVFSDVVAKVLGLDPTMTLLTLSTLVILYSVLGGFRAIVFTDVLQFAIISVGLPVMIYLLYGYLGDRFLTISYAPEGKPFDAHFFLYAPKHGVFNQLGKYMSYLLIGFSPPLFQRCLVNKDVSQTRKAFRRGALGYAYIVMLAAFVGRMLATEPAGLSSDNLLESVLVKYAYLGFKTVIAFVVTAMTLSSADSYINTSAVLLSEISHRKSLLSVRLFGVLTSVVGMSVVLFMQDKGFRGLLALWRISSLCYAPVVGPTLILALLGFRTSRRCALLSMAGSLLVGLGVNIGNETPHAMVLGALSNVLLMFVLHYGLKESGGWVGIKDRAPLMAHAQLRQRRWASWWASIQDFNLLRYLKRNLPRKEGHYIFFGFYVLTFIFGGVFFLPQQLMRDERIAWMLGSFLLLNSITMTYPIWPKEVKRRWLIAPFWALNVGYALFYIGMLWLLLGDFQWAHMALFVVNLILGMLLFRRKLMVFWVVLGGLMAVLTCHVMGHPMVFNVTLELGFALAVALAGLSALCVSQQKRRRLVWRYLTLGSLQRSTEDALTALCLTPDHFAKQLVETNHAGVDAAYQMSKKRLGETDELTQQINTSAHYLAKTIQLIQTQTQLDQRVYPFSKFLNRLYDRYPDLDKAGLILYNESSATTIKWDIYKMHQLLYKTYHYLKRHHPGVSYSYLHVRDTRLKYPGRPKLVPAVAFVFAFHTQRPHIAASYAHIERLEASLLLGNGYWRELYTLTEKHRGYLDLSQSPHSALVVLPLRLDKVPTPLLEDYEVPHKSFEDDMVRESKFMEGDFWVRVTQQPHYNISEIEQVVRFMKAAHQHKTRRDNTPYYAHPLCVAKYVSEYDLQPHLLMAALLHDIVEDTHVTLEEVGIRFGDQVAQLVKETSHLDLDTFKTYQGSNEKTYAEWLSQNRGPILIKACDRVHNLETLHVMPSAKQRAKAQETLDYYVPLVEAAEFPDLAHRLAEMSKRFL